MSESTLTLTYDDLRKEVAFFLGYGRKGDAGDGLTADQATIVNAIVASGLRRFYHPASGHEWSFLRPEATITAWATITATTTSGAPVYDASTYSTVTVAASTFAASMVGSTLTIGSNTYLISSYTSATVVVVEGDASGEGDGADVTLTSYGKLELPYNFGGIIAPVTFDYNAGLYIPLEHINESHMRELRQGDMNAGRPWAYNVEPHPQGFYTGSVSQRFFMNVFPPPDQDYTLRYRYNALPDHLSAETDYPLGGETHAETILESCLSVAEQRMDDEVGLHTQAFAERLASSIMLDQKLMAPDTFGYNRDAGQSVSRQRITSYDITYNDVRYPV